MKFEQGPGTKPLWRQVSGLVILMLAAAPVQGQSIAVSVDPSLADYLLGIVCSGKEVDADYLRNLPVLQSQVKHHSNFSPRRDFNAFMSGLEAAARCETLDEDPYYFQPVVERKEEFERAVAFFKEHSAEIEASMTDRLSPYVPEHLDYEGDLVLSIVGNTCGGFSMDSMFFLALNCLRNSYETELETAKLIAAHETWHDLQYEFFHPFEESIDRVHTLDDAYDYHFLNLMLEGTAEFVADSRDLTGSGEFTDFLKDMTRDAYRKLPFYFRLFGYTVELLQTDELMQRLKDVYQLGYAGDSGQAFYFVGAEMTRGIEEAFGREQLICILGLPPEQFVRAYHAAAEALPDEALRPLSRAAVEAAERLGERREAALRLEHCTAPAN